MPDTLKVVSFGLGTQAQYDALAIKEEGKLYFAGDSQRLFVGDKEYTRPVGHGTSLPTSKLPPNSLFVVEGESATELFFSKDGAEWVSIVSVPKGVTAGTFGETANGIATWGDKVIVPKITVDEHGFVTAISNIEITLPTETALSTTTEGEGNAVTEIVVNGHAMTVKKAITFATAEELGTEVDKLMPKAGGVFTGPITIKAPDGDMNPATKAYVDQAIAGMTHFDYQIVTELPDTGVKGTIYLMANKAESGNNVFDEYLWITQGEASKFERIGSLDIDLSGYAKTADLPVASDAAPLVAGAAAAAGSSNDYARADHVHPEQVNVTGNAGTADKLKTAHTIGVEGALTAEAQTFDGSGDVSLNVTAVDGTKVTGKVPTAAAADAADKATKDGDGKVIKDTYATKDEVKASKMVWEGFAPTSAE